MARKPQVTVNHYHYNNSRPRSNYQRPPRKEQSLLIHAILFFTTVGIGNVVYYLLVRNENLRNGYR